MKLLIILTIIFGFAGCITRMTKSNLPEEIKLSVPEKPKSITVKIGGRIISTPSGEYNGLWYFAFDKSNFSDFQDILNQSKVFDVKQVKTITDLNLKYTETAKVKEVEDRDAFNKDSDYQLNIYRKFRHGHGPVLFFIAWGVVHVGTLGLVPLWQPISEDYYGDIRSREGKVLFSFNKSCEGLLVSWSPYLLKVDWDYQHVLNQKFHRDCILSIIEDAQKSNVF